ncbi:hypothetical protein MFM001_45850 [Mycobacterium sp. MFM001]|nr:hypothetical protein MFM001_45850 [Mycobacterium sp. MFM001]
MRQRYPNRAGIDVGVRAGDFPERNMHRGLGNAVHVDQARRSRVVVQPRLKTLGLKRFAAKHDSLEFQLAGLFG